MDRTREGCFYPAPAASIWQFLFDGDGGQATTGTAERYAEDLLIQRERRQGTMFFVGGTVIERERGRGSVWGEGFGGGSIMHSFFRCRT